MRNNLPARSAVLQGRMPMSTGGSVRTTARTYDDDPGPDHDDGGPDNHDDHFYTYDNSRTDDYDHNDDQPDHDYDDNHDVSARNLRHGGRLHLSRRRLPVWALQHRFGHVLHAREPRGLCADRLQGERQFLPEPEWAVHPECRPKSERGIVRRP